MGIYMAKGMGNNLNISDINIFDSSIPDLARPGNWVVYQNGIQTDLLDGTKAPPKVQDPALRMKILARSNPISKLLKSIFK